MELRLLRYFAAVAEELNVTRAAEKLHTAQPSLSQQIRQLEGLIGAPLFIRDKHRLKLTETGKVFLPAARSILAAVENAFFQARATARNEVGTIVLGMIPGPEGMVFSHILPLLLRRSPETQLLLRTMTAPEAIQALLKREIMAGFLRGPIDSDEIASEIYMREEVVAMLPEHWELARMERVPVKELAKMPLIGISAAIAPAVHHAADEIERRAGVKLTQGIGSESLMTSMNAVASGLGYGLFAEYVGGIVPKGVVTRPIDLDPAPTLDLLFAYRKDDPFAALATLISLVHDHSPYREQTALEK
jgi:LysR family hca operon transcriptional activator